MKIEIVKKRKLISHINYGAGEGLKTLCIADVDTSTKIKMMEIGELVNNNPELLDLRSLGNVFEVPLWCIAREGLNKDQLNFLASDEYIAAQHACDLLSGAFINLLTPYVIHSYMAYGKIACKDFETYSDDPYLNIPPEYLAYRDIFVCKNKAGKDFILTMAELEHALETLR